MARAHREVSHATISEVCEAFDELANDLDIEEPLLFKFDDVYLDVESITRTDNGALVINLQEA